MSVNLSFLSFSLFFVGLLCRGAFYYCTVILLIIKEVGTVCTHDIDTTG